MLIKIQEAFYKIRNWFVPYKSTENSYSTLTTIKNIAIEEYLQKHLYNNPKYNNEPLNLNNFEKQVFSQYGEDGILQEIFKRIGTTNKYFVEFGVETGVQNNTTFLLHQQWKGLWIDGSKKYTEIIKQNFAKLIKQDFLKLENSFINAENIELLFEKNNVPLEFDLLSIDIDRNDYYVWQAIKKYTPRVIVIEYNAIFPPPVEWTVDYDANKTVNYTSNFGASLQSYVNLANSKGYSLVACNFTGVNAFFVKTELIIDQFLYVNNIEKLYQSPKYNLLKTEGHTREIRL
jgi:hypothetical protein